MKSLKEHNKEARKPVAVVINNAGVLCDKCGEPMVYSDPGQMCASMPPCYKVHCPECKLFGLKY